MGVARPLNKIILTAMLCAAAAPATAKVYVDHDPGVDFSGFRTYAWISGTPSISPAGEALVRSALDGALQAHGLEQVDRAPELFVASHVTRSDRQQISMQTYGGPAARSGWDVSANGPQDVPVGTLIVDIVDARSKRLIWRGTGTATLSGKLSRNEKKLNKVLAKMFREFPPRGR